MNRRHASNVFWSGSEAAISASLSFVSAFVVARLVGPAEVGIGAAAVAVHVLLWVAVNALFVDALVQRSEVDDTTFSTAFVMSALVGCGAALVQAAAAHPLAWSLSTIAWSPCPCCWQCRCPWSARLDRYKAC